MDTTNILNILSNIGQLVPPILPGLLAALTVAYALYDLLIKRRFLASKAEKDLRHVLSEGFEEAQEEELPPDSWAYKFQVAGIDIDADAADAYLYGGSALAGIAVFLAVLALGLPVIFGVVLGGLAAMTPAAWLNGRVKARAQQVEKELPMALQRLAVNIRLNPDIAEALAAVAETLPQDSPLAAEFRRTARESRTGGQNQALEALEQRSQLLSPSLATVAFQLQRYAEKGGAAFGEAFTAAAENLHRILEGRNKGEAKASEAMGAIKIIPAMLGLVMVYFMSDPAMRATFQLPIMQLFMVGLVIWMALGYWFMRGLVEEIG